MKASQVPNVLPVILNCVLVTIFQDLFFLPASGELHRWWPFFLHLNSQFLICCQNFYFLNILNHKHFPMSPLSLVYCSLITLTSPVESMRGILQGIKVNCHGEQTSGCQECGSWGRVGEGRTGSVGLVAVCAVLGCSVVSDSLQPRGVQPSRPLCPWGFSRQEYRSGFPCLLQGIFPTQGLEPQLSHSGWILYCLSHQGSVSGWPNGLRHQTQGGISRCKLLHIKWINNKVLLYSTGNYIQSPVINHNGKEYKKNISV